MRLVVRAKPRNAPDALHLRRAAITVSSRPLRVLDFDIENRPLSYLGHDFTTAEVTAVSWAWTDRSDETTVCLLGEMELADILAAFVNVYNEADVITGHFVRGHDLPMVNGALMELGLPLLTDKMTQDTKLDLARTKGISLSQESLGAMLRLEEQKVTMNQFKWRQANRLTKEGIRWVRERVSGDVRQHIEMRRELITRGYLSRMTKWKSNSSQPLAQYSA